MNIKNWVIKKLGAYTEEEVKAKEDEARKGLGGAHGGHTIHFPEYKDNKGRVHLHLCPLGNWKDNEEEWCKEIPFERSEHGVLRNKKLSTNN